jgi:hypothetical protein
MFSPETLWGVGIAVLLAALVWGLIQYRNRNRANDPITEEATRELYDDPDNYEQRREELNKQVRPS